MKVVIVLDTEDEQGLADAYSIARKLYTKQKKQRYHAPSETITIRKHDLLVILRSFGAKAVNEFCEKFEISRTPAGVRYKPSLKLAKEEGDLIFDEKN